MDRLPNQFCSGVQGPGGLKLMHMHTPSIHNTPSKSTAQLKKKRNIRMGLDMHVEPADLFIK